MRGQGALNENQEVLMKVERAGIPITDLIKMWCEYCRIRIDPDEERTRLADKIYHPHCYSKLFPAILEPKA
jgi:hypothetical protein